ncbi:unnamed protein product [Nezara viridula]|uniref:Reverse transcriptase domain-containing protein n=1 Tax=Nezara viridula TaxID=85310 RepID=A0A9P0E3A2_NEZVI|nr:unnamed protein product [Nezara viridula]
MGVPLGIRKIVSDYFKDRTLIYGTEDDPRFQVTGGGRRIPQCSVLELLLWNIMYGGVLRHSLPDGSRTVGFADDLAVVVEAKCKEEVMQKANQSIKVICNWLATMGLQYIDHKKEALLNSSRKRDRSP